MKSWVADRSVSVPMTLIDLERGVRGQNFQEDSAITLEWFDLE